VRAIHGGGPNKGEDYFATCGSTVWHEGDDIDMPCACTTATANSTATLAVGDIDGDGIPEIVVPNENSGLTVLDNTGEPIAETGPNQWVSYPGPAPVIANLDNDGLAEIVVGRHAFTMSKDLQMLFVNRFSGTLMNGINNLGPVPCVADIAGDSRPEIVAGSTVYAFPEPPPGVTTIEECPGGAMDDFCLGRLTVVWDAQAVNGSVVVPNAQRDGFCAIADVLGTDETIAPGPDNPLDGTAEVVLVGEGYLQIYNGQTGLSRRFINMGLGSDGGTPALADTDNDGFPEIGVGFGARYALVDLQSASPSCPAWPNAFVDSGSGLQGNAPRTPGAACAVDGDCAGGAVCRSGNCVCLHNGWQRVIEDDSSRATAAAAFDMNGDGASEILYNDECYLRMYDGTTGEVLLKHRSPSRTRIESPVVADADRDGRAEIVWSSNTDASLCSEGSNYPNGVFMFGDSSETWVPTRSIWNQHSYHVTNVADDAGIPVIEANSWIDQGEQPFNTYRSNTNTCPVP
ncbi:MAG TPA: FG-GAP-like repeat-containing protein, partial [Candidatus Binatia bacterium]|nr:FG-GAP-like repeat-containing protein [Candidatus Binatia bacterium]